MALRFLPEDWHSDLHTLMSAFAKSTARIELKGPVPTSARHILTDEAMAFVAELVREFQARRDE